MSKTPAQFHKLSHEHHVGKIAAHKEEISAHKAAMDAEEEGSERHAYHKAMIAANERHIAQHEPLRDFHKSMEKAAGDEMNKADGAVPAALEDVVRSVLVKMLGDQLVPTSVSAVAPTAPRAVARPGQPEIPAKPNVDPQFAKLVSVENEDEASVHQ